MDELDALIGLARAESLPRDIDVLLHRIQHELFGVGADLATPGPAAGGLGLTADRHVERLERDIDNFDAQVPPLQQFILPGGVRSAALLHLAERSAGEPNDASWDLSFPVAAKRSRLPSFAISID